MLGLKTQESDKFLNFFSLIQAQAKVQKCTFFGFAGEGREFETDTIEGMDFSGWLVPDEKVPEFMPLWENYTRVDELEGWADHFVFAIWSGDAVNPQIQFIKF